MRDEDLQALATEAVNPTTVDLDRMTAAEIVQAMNAQDATVAAAVQRELPQIARAVTEIAGRVHAGGRLIYIGAGTSGRLGVLDASECPPTFGTSPETVIGWIAGGPSALTHAAEDVEDDAVAGGHDAATLNIGAGDSLVGITASGRTPYVLGAIAHARAHGAFTIGLTCNADTPLAAVADLTIAPLVGPEVLSGSTRLKAGTAQKMVLNMLSTGTMVLLGKTYGNLMVDMHPTNAKLRQRAVHIVQRATGLPEDEATAILHTSGDETKTAIVAALAHISPEEARARLAAHVGVVRAALGDTK